MSTTNQNRPQSGVSRAISGGGSAGRTSFSEVREDVSAVKEDLTKLGSDAVGYATGAAMSVADTAREKARHGSEAAMDAAKKAADYGRQTHEQICDFVRERPTASILLAVGLGAIIARVLLPRR